MWLFFSPDPDKTVTIPHTEVDRRPWGAELHGLWERLLRHCQKAPLQTLREHLLCRVLCPQRPHTLLQEARSSVWQLLWWAPGLIGPLSRPKPLCKSRSPWPLHSKHRSCTSRVGSSCCQSDGGNTKLNLSSSVQCLCHLRAAFTPRWVKNEGSAWTK